MAEKYKLTEVGKIPSVWEVKSLNDISKITRLAGYEYSSMWQEDEKGEIIALRGFNIGQNKIIEKDFVRISNKLSLKLSRSRLFKRNVIYPCVGTIGNAAVIEEDDKYHIQQNIAKISPDEEKIDAYYLAHYLMSSFGLNEIFKFNGTSSQPNILVGSLRQYSIVVPPLKEQTAIATALSDADNYINSLEKLIAKKQLIKQGAMQKLLTPKADWVVKKLGEVADLKNGFAFKSINYDGKGEFLIITIANVQGGYMDTNECNRIVSLPKQIQSHQKLVKEDLLISMTGNVGRVCKVNIENALLNQRVGKIIPLNIDSDFLFHLLNSKSFLEEMILSAQGGAQGNISKNDILGFETSIPKDKTEQTRIATILSDMDADIAATEKQLAKARSIKQGMMQQLLTGKIRLI